MPTPNDREKLFDESRLIVSKTDTKGNITYGNELFIELSGYGVDSLIGSPHNIIRHPDMPASVFKLLWDTIQSGKEINAFVKNMSKDGSFYWVLANVTPSYNSKKEIIGYYSVRRKPKREKVELVTQIYAQMLEAEKKGSIDDGTNILLGILKEKGITYDQFINA